MVKNVGVRAAGLFSGVGGLELGLASAGIETSLMCEWWEPAQVTLKQRFDTDIVGDIRKLAALPGIDVVTAGFPCTDLSQVGRTKGIEGDESGLVREVFRLVKDKPPTWLVLENVPNMLTLHGGAPIEAVTTWLEDHGWNWAYRIVDSQHFGVRQRRRRVFIVASQIEDPRTVLFADETSLSQRKRQHSAYGFYWTEGNRGIGWGEGVTPTLKGGSKLGIASPPAVWRRGFEVGTAIVRPSITVGEQLQGFRPGWTNHVDKEGVRWKLIGNAVTVPVAKWIGRRLAEPGEPVDVTRRPLTDLKRWPSAASRVGGPREAWALSERPLTVAPRRSLLTLLEGERGHHQLSLGAARGFSNRLRASSLNRDSEFEQALTDHVALLTKG